MDAWALPKNHTTTVHQINPQRSNCVSLDLDVEISGASWVAAMTSQKNAVIPYAPEAKNAGPEAEIVDRAGNAILGLVSRAADAAAADLQEAREVAERLALQLQASRDRIRAADDQINALKADVRLYRDRANRAEKWLQQISSEIEQKFLGADDSRVRRAPPQNENNNPTRFSFLRRQQGH
jgi:chromosome segregation ATPase